MGECLNQRNDRDIQSPLSRENCLISVSVIEISKIGSQKGIDFYHALKVLRGLSTETREGASMIS
jgi:hypothetical protein